MPSPSTVIFSETAQTFLDSFKIARAQAHLNNLCSVPFAGRRIGTVGHDLAQAWLVEQMQAIDLKTQVSTFAADASVLGISALPEFVVIENDGTINTLEYRRDFQEHPQSARQNLAVQGIVTRSTSESVVGWVVLDTPPTAETADALKARGAVGLLLPQHTGPEGYLPKRIVARQALPLPVISVRADLLAQLEGKHIRANMPVKSIPFKGGHVIGSITGSDASLANTPLLVGAHFDGVGDDVSGFRLPGAADNAAGVSVVLEVARVIKESGQSPRRPIIFAAFDGEEINALGSQAYAASLKAQGISPIVINLDGAARFHEAVWAELSDNAAEIIQALDQVGEWLEIPLIVGAVGSDNRRYAQMGFPTVGLALGGLGGHTPADTVENVDPDAMSLAGRLLLGTISQLAF